jgi:hypothetical protein
MCVTISGSVDVLACHVQIFLALHENSRVSYRAQTVTGRFIMFSVITKIYNKKTKGPTFMELFTAT